jgi:O-acetylserine/cysteine efflux transporter
MTKRQIYGISIAFIGVIIVIISNTISNPFEILEQISSNGSEKNFFSYFDKNNIISLIFLFISVFSWPIYAIFSKKLSNEDVKESEIIGWTAFFGSFFGLIVSFIFEKNQIQSIQSANLIELSYFLYAALFGVLIPHTILHYLIKIYDVSKISGFSLLIPFFTAIGGVIFFGEKITLLLAIGGLILIFGLYISQSSKTENIAQVR